MDPSRSALRELSTVGRRGRLEIAFALKDGRTILRDCYSEIPHKTTRPYYSGKSLIPQLILVNSTAGLFGGDSVETHIHVQEGARAIITTQASTKVHPGPGPAEQQLRFDIDAGAELQAYHDPIIPFAGSRLRQRIRLRLTDQSRMYLWDGFMAGRVARGEKWRFEEFDTELQLLRDGKQVYLERFRLRPDDWSPHSPWMMRDYSYVATGLFYDDRIAPEPIHAQVPEAGVDRPTESLIAVRVVARSGVELRSIRERLLRTIFDQTGEKLPDLRKNDP